MPDLDISIIANNDPPSGCGEPGVTVVAPAIANAIFNAVGARVRSPADHGGGGEGGDEGLTRIGMPLPVYGEVPEGGGGGRPVTALKSDEDFSTATGLPPPALRATSPA